MHMPYNTSISQKTMYVLVSMCFCKDDKTYINFAHILELGEHQFTTVNDDGSLSKMAHPYFFRIALSDLFCTPFNYMFANGYFLMQ